MNKILCLVAIVVLLSGCSSPPHPLKIEWYKPATEMNTELINWKPNNVISPSPVITSHWTKKIINFKPTNIFPSTIWYLVAHSSQAIIFAPDSNSYFSAKMWLKNGGYNGPVTYKNKDTSKNTLNTPGTDIYLSR